MDLRCGGLTPIEQRGFSTRCKAPLSSHRLVYRQSHSHRLGSVTSSRSEVHVTRGFHRAGGAVNKMSELLHRWASGKILALCSRCGLSTDSPESCSSRSRCNRSFRDSPSWFSVKCDLRRHIQHFVDRVPQNVQSAKPQFVISGGGCC